MPLYQGLHNFSCATVGCNGSGWRGAEAPSRPERTTPIVRRREDGWGRTATGPATYGRYSLAQLRVEAAHEGFADAAMEVIGLLGGERFGRVAVLDREGQAVASWRNLPAGVAVNERHATGQPAAHRVDRFLNRRKRG